MFTDGTQGQTRANATSVLNSTRAPDSALRARRVIPHLMVGIAACASLFLTACRTTEGAGRDIEALGDNIADSADKHKP